MKYYKLFLFVFIATNIVCYGQMTNLVQNSSFEEFEAMHPNSPNNHNEFKHLKYWKRINTSDAYSTLPGKITGTYNANIEYSPPLGSDFWSLGAATLTPHSGNGYAGLGQCEGGRIDLSSPIEPGHWAHVKFYCTFRGSNSSAHISILLTTTLSANNIYDFNSQGGDENCDGIDASRTHLISEHDLTSGQFTSGIWTLFETYIFNNTDKNLDSFFILGPLGNSPRVGGYSKNYIYIDDVEVFSLDFCEHPCASDLGPVQFGEDAINNNTASDLNTLPNAMVGNCDGCIVEVNGQNQIANRFTLLNKNVNIFKFTVFSSWGQIEHKTELYSLSPLTNAGYSDWLFDWNGFGNINGADLPADVYTYQIEMRACNNDGYVNASKSLTLLGINQPPAHQPPLPNVYTSEACCPNERYIQNTTFETAHDYKHKVDEFILIGPDVNPSPFIQNGEVIFEPRTNVLFEAGNYVEFIPGASIYNGPIDIDLDLSSVLNNNVTVNIKPCISPNRNSGSPRDNFQYSNEKFIINNLNPLSNNNLIELYPTVTSNIFKLKSSLFNIEKVEIIDNNGKVVHTEIKSFKETEIDCTALSSGFYFVKLFLENGAVVYKKIVKVE